MLLESAYRKVGHASDRMRSLHREMSSFFSQTPAPMGPPLDSSRPIELVQLAPLPVAWSLAIGDCLQNLRSAVEHAFFECAIRVNPTADRRSIQFPIALTEPKWLKSNVHSYLSEEFTSGIRRLQPFLARDPSNHPMWVLHELAIQDRHMELIIAAVFPKGVQVHFDLNTNGNVVTQGTLAGTLAADGGARSFAYPDGSPFTGRLSYPFEVVFFESLAAQEMSVLGVLAGLCDFVEDEVLPALESNFFL